MAQARIARPGTQRVQFTGIVAVPDDFGRIRILITSYQQKQLTQQAAFLPIIQIDRPSDEYHFIVNVTAQYRHEYWLKVAEERRGQIVTVEATVRPNQNHSLSLDLAMIT
jgi:hypothetical protein